MAEQIPFENIAWQTLRLNLDSATTQRPLAIAGHYLKVIDASSPAALATLLVNRNDGRQQFDLRIGSGFQHMPFNRLYVTWTAQPAAWLDVAIIGRPQDARLELFDVFHPNVDPDNAQAVTQGTASVPWLIDTETRTPGATSARAFDIAGYTGSATWVDITPTFITNFDIRIESAYLVTDSTTPGDTAELAINATSPGATPDALALAHVGCPFSGWQNVLLETGNKLWIRSSNAAQYTFLSGWATHVPV